ncbi:hypothetical protein PMAYCL1PPCAC_31475, partial [Pristionchus mayeri]
NLYHNSQYTNELFIAYNIHPRILLSLASVESSASSLRASEASRASHRTSGESTCTWWHGWSSGGDDEISQFWTHRINGGLDLLASLHHCEILCVLERSQLVNSLLQLPDGSGEIGTTLRLLSLHCGLELGHFLLDSICGRPRLDCSLELCLRLVLVSEQLEEGFSAVLGDVCEEGRTEIDTSMSSWSSTESSHSSIESALVSSNHAEGRKNDSKTVHSE